MAVEEQYVDWRGNAVDGKKHGGIRATLFLYVLVALRSCPNSANFSLVAYLHSTLHLGIVSSSTVITFLVGAASISTALMSFICQAYIKRSTAVFVFGPFVIFGYALLALQAHLPWLHPPPCHTSEGGQSICEPAHGWTLALLYLCLLLFAVGEGSMRACLPPLCADQFSGDDPSGSVFKRRSLGFHKFANSLGAVLGLVFLVWVQNNLGWDIGFMVSALVVLLGLTVAACGVPLYQVQKPTGSPLTRILQVIVAALRKRHSVIHDSVALQEIGGAISCIDGEDNSLHGKRQGFLDKACVYAGDTSPWSFCSAAQVDEAKAVLRMLPVLASSAFILLPFTLLMTLTIQVGRTMDQTIGSSSSSSRFQISSASLIAIPTAFHMLLQPFLRRLAGNEHGGGIGPLRRIGAGSACGVAASCAAALVESRRIAAAAAEHGLVRADAEVPVPMSVFWLVAQFFLLSAMEAAASDGVAEFVRAEAPPGMKAVAPAVQSALVGLATWSACAFVQVFGGGGGWLDGSNFNRTSLDRFFLLLAGFEFVALVNYCFWARKYAKDNTKTVVRLEDEEES